MDPPSITGDKNNLGNWAAAATQISETGDTAAAAGAGATIFLKTKCSEKARTSPTFHFIESTDKRYYTLIQSYSQSNMFKHCFYNWNWNTCLSMITIVKRRYVLRISNCPLLTNLWILRKFRWCLLATDVSRRKYVVSGNTWQIIIRRRGYKICRRSGRPQKLSSREVLSAAN